MTDSGVGTPRCAVGTATAAPINPAAKASFRKKMFTACLAWERNRDADGITRRGADLKRR